MEKKEASSGEEGVSSSPLQKASGIFPDRSEKKKLVTPQELLREFNARYGLNIGEQDFQSLYSPDVRKIVLKDILPWMESRLGEGVLPDIRQVAAQNAIIVRDPENGLETLRRQADGLHDVRSLDVELGLYLRSLPDVDVAGRTALAHMLPPMIMPTLTLNLEASQQRDAVIQRAVKPVLHRVQRGEVVVRAGDTVSDEQQLKMQALAGPGPGLVDWMYAPGVFLLSCLLGLGLFLLPASSKEDVRPRGMNCLSLCFCWCSAG